MKIGGVVLYGGAPRGRVVPLLLRRRRISLRVSSSSSYSSISGNAFLFLSIKPFRSFLFISHFHFSSVDHVSFVKDVAATQPPQHLSHLLSILKTRGKSIPS